MKKKAEGGVKLHSNVLTDEFVALEDAVQEDAKHLESINADIRLLQEKLKKFVFQMGGYVSVAVEAGGRAGWDFTKKQFVYMGDNDADMKPLLSTPPQVKKEIYAHYLPTILRQIKEEFLMHKEIEQEGAR